MVLFQTLFFKFQIMSTIKPDLNTDIGNWLFHKSCLKDYFSQQNFKIVRFQRLLFDFIEKKEHIFFGYPTWYCWKIVFRMYERNGKGCLDSNWRGRNCVSGNGKGTWEILRKRMVWLVGKKIKGEKGYGILLPLPSSPSLVLFLLDNSIMGPSKPVSQ